MTSEPEASGGSGKLDQQGNWELTGLTKLAWGQGECAQKYLRRTWKLAVKFLAPHTGVNSTTAMRAAA